MIVPVVQYGYRCLVDMFLAIRRFVFRKHTYHEFRHELRDVWLEFRDDVMTPPKTPERKSALREVNKGVRLYNDKRYAEALTAFELARDTDPTYGRAWLYLGNALYKRSRQSEAVSAWERAIAVEPRSKAADKARMKMDRLRAKNRRAIDELHDQIKGK